MALTVLVTGAAGLLGSACVEALLARGDRPVALVRDRDPRSRFYAEGMAGRCTEIRAELADAGRVLAEHRPDAVIHLAAQTQVPVANAEPLSTFESNVRGTWLLLEACRVAAHRPSAIVVASSDKAYGAAPLPYREDGPLRPRAPYDVSKAATDLVARSYGGHFGLPVAVTRCANVYGPGDLNFERLVPGTCRALARGRRPALRSTGRMTREWLHVSDAAAACLHLLDRAAAERGRAFNVGSGRVATALEVARRLVELAGCDLEVLAAPADPPGEIPRQALDSSRIRASGWAPRVSLEDGLAGTWAWYRELLSERRA